MLKTIKEISRELNEGNIPYQFYGPTSHFLQGIQTSEERMLYILVQWDLLESAYKLFSPFSPTSIVKDHKIATFSFLREDITVRVSCYFNTTIKTDPYRIVIRVDETEIWCTSIYFSLEWGSNEEKEIIHQFLLHRQQEMNTVNESSWNQNNYLALINRYGLPKEIAVKIKQNPEWRLHPFYKYFTPLKDQKVVHLMGSNGVKAVALSLLGASVTVVDFSRENERFAREVSEEAGVSIQYIVSDVLSIQDKISLKGYNYVLLELGVLHYFIDLAPLAKIIYQLLEENGTLILHEFHPISTKLITSAGKKHKITGNYFDPTIKESVVAFTKHLPSDEQQKLSKVYQRHWTLGEIVTSFAKEGLYVEELVEEPNHKVHDIGLPKTFTLVARKK